MSAMTHLPIDPVIQAYQDALRKDLGFRPETRLDHLILPDGTTYELQSDGTLEHIDGHLPPVR